MNLHSLTHHHGHGGTALHRLPAGIKLAVTLIILVGTVTVPPPCWPWFAGVGTLLALMIIVGELSISFLARRLVALSPLVLGVALVNAWQPAGHGDWRWIALRSSLCLLTVTVVTNTTSLTEMVHVLRAVRVPGLLVTTITLMHRYLYVLGDESSRMRRARASRTFTATRPLEWHTRASVVGQLFVRASERAERVYDAMRARGWR
jgi:cobalt/nickel transport system permease protein